MATSGQFYLNKHCSTELLQEMLTYFDQAPVKDKRPASIGLLSARRVPPAVVTVIFDICKYLKLNHYVRYLAVEILDRFLHMHVAEVKRSIGERSNPRKSWKDTERKITKQIMLRLVTCISLAHKFYRSKENYALGKQFVQFLKLLHYPFDLNQLHKSELRVLKTLDYCVSIPLPFSCIQVLLSSLSFNLKMSPAQFYPALYEVLDFFYLRRSELRQTLSRRCHEKLPG